MELPKEIKDEIWNFCRMNDIPSVDNFIIKMVKQGFTSEKYGSTPWDKPVEIVEKIIENVVEKEVIKEVPVEVIKEVEKIIEKEVFVTDDEAVNFLQKEISDLKVILKDTINDIDEERKAHSIICNDYDKEITELNVKIETLNREISDLNNKSKQLEEELKIEKIKPKQEDNDIYGEQKGFFGSNLSDLWDKKKR
jgi:hypothetical protein